MAELLYYMRRVRELGIRESMRQAKTIIADRTAARINGMYDRYFAPNIEEETDALLKRLFSASNFVNDLKTRTLPCFVLDREPEFYRRSIQSHFPEEERKIIAAADQAKNGTFDLLGSGPRSFGELPWHVDFKSGYAWDPNQYYREIRYGHIPGVDVKIPWELSRFQHAAFLGQAYWLTGNEEYASTFRKHVLDWIEKNPCRYGVNWLCAMDVGIRAVNWIWGFFFFRKSPSIDTAFLKEFLRSLKLHARFIRENLEYRTATVQGQERRLNSNHYLSNLIGLLYIGLLFPELNATEDAEFAKREMCIEIFEQTYADGADYEHSTFYHRLVTEIFLSGFLLLKRNGHVLPADVEDRLQKMGEYIADYLRPDGTAPQIGDADNGRLHPLAIRDMADHRYVPLVIAETYHRKELRIVDRDVEALWWIGATPSPASEASRHSAQYVNKGFSILRCPKAHVLVSAAPICMHGLGSHSHNDILSFEYWSQGRPWIIDPGTYIYTPDPASRNYFRSTQAHNTVRIDQGEINPFFPERLFQLPDHAHLTHQGWQETPDFVEVAAEHDGYEVLHRRNFRLDKNTGNLEILDTLTGAGSHQFEWFFHVSPDSQVENFGSAVSLRHDGSAITLHFDDDTVQCENADGWYSPSYGIRVPAQVITIQLVRSAPFKFGIWIINSYAPDFRHE